MGNGRRIVILMSVVNSHKLSGRVEFHVQTVVQFYLISPELEVHFCDDYRREVGLDI